MLDHDAVYRQADLASGRTGRVVVRWGPGRVQFAYRNGAVWKFDVWQVVAVADDRYHVFGGPSGVGSLMVQRGEPRMGQTFNSLAAAMDELWEVELAGGREAALVSAVPDFVVLGFGYSVSGS